MTNPWGMYVTLPEPVFRRVQELAAENDQRPQAIIVRAVREHLARMDGRKPGREGEAA